MCSWRAMQIQMQEIVILEKYGENKLIRQIMLCVFVVHHFGAAFLTLTLTLCL